MSTAAKILPIFEAINFLCSHSMQFNAIAFFVV
jgi:hypothetical protein